MRIGHPSGALTASGPGIAAGSRAVWGRLVAVGPARSHRTTAWSVGLLGTLVTAGVFFAALEGLPPAVPALLLLVPIVLASTLGGWRIGVTIAVFAALVYCLGFLPPIGGIRIGLTEDVYVLIAFVAVALLVGVLTGRGRAVAPETLDDERAMLLRSVSHDLRTPLSTIHTVSADLRDSDDYDAETRRELMGMVANEADRLNRIVANLLSVSRVQAGTFQPELEAVAVEALLVDAADRIRDQVPVAVVTETCAGLPEVLADRVQIDQVLANLIENSARLAPAGSVVTLRASLDGDEVRVAVHDHGPGFSETERARAFALAGSGSGSSGLGLTVCRAIVEAHGGTIRIDDEGSTGATVSFTLRCAPSVDPAPADRSLDGNMAET